LATLSFAIMAAVAWFTAVIYTRFEAHSSIFKPDGFDPAFAATSLFIARYTANCPQLSAKAVVIASIRELPSF